eukprot:scaffold132710_cov23-Tisochrysis_lutea.AAC.1
MMVTLVALKYWFVPLAADSEHVVFSEVQAAVAASGGYLQIPDLYINMANVALAKQPCKCLPIVDLVVLVEYATALRLYKIAQEKLGKNNKQNLRSPCEAISSSPTVGTTLNPRIVLNSAVDQP